MVVLKGVSSVEPHCAWPTASELRISLPARTSLRPGDVLDLLPGRIYPIVIAGYPMTSCVGPDGLDKCFAGSVIIRPPLHPLSPILSLQGPSQLSACESLQLRAQVVRDSGVFPLFFNWSASAITQGGELDHAHPALNGLRAALEAAGSRPLVVISATLLPADIRFQFSVVASSELSSPSNMATLTAVRSQRLLLSATFEGSSNVQTVRRSRPLTLVAAIHYPNADCMDGTDLAPALSNVQMRYNWVSQRSVATPELVLRESWISQQGRVLTIPSSVLSPGASYSILMIAAAEVRRYRNESNGILADNAPVRAVGGANASITIIVQPEPLTCSIVGGRRRRISRNSALRMEGVASETGERSTFTWSCERLPDLSSPHWADSTCLDAAGLPVDVSGESQRAGRLLLAPGTFAAAGNVTFSLHVRSGSSTAECFTEIEITDSPTLEVAASVDVRGGSVFQRDADTLIDVGQRVVLSGKVENEGSVGSVAYEWSSSSYSTLTALTAMPPSLHTIVLLPNAIKAGELHSFRLQASAPDFLHGYVDLFVRGSRPPSDGFAVAIPTVGEQLKASFQLEQSGWSAEQDLLPVSSTRGVLSCSSVCPAIGLLHSLTSAGPVRLLAAGLHI